MDRLEFMVYLFLNIFLLISVFFALMYESKDTFYMEKHEPLIVVVFSFSYSAF